MNNILIAGIGSGGCQMLSRLYDSGFTSGQMAVIDTDMVALNSSSISTRLQIGQAQTRGQGSGADISIGKASSTEDSESIKTLLQDVELLILVVGLGGGTGTGAAPVVAEIARNMGIRTVAYATLPFEFEGTHCAQRAKEGLAQLARAVDAAVPLSLEEYTSSRENTSLVYAFTCADAVLRKKLEAICAAMNEHGLSDVDSALKNEAVVMLPPETETVAKKSRFEKLLRFLRIKKRLK